MCHARLGIHMAREKPRTPNPKQRAAPPDPKPRETKRAHAEASTVWKWLVAVFAVLAVLCGGAGFFLFGTAQGKQLVDGLKPKERPTEVRLSAVERGSLVRIVSAPGV